MRNKELILDNFEHGDLSKYETSHTYVDSYQITICNEKSKKGTNSLKFTYDYGGWKSANGAMPIKFKDVLQTEDQPVKVGLWVYGQGEVPWLRMTLLDGNGERKTVNLTLETMNWYGWKFVDAKIDPAWTLPIQVEQIYAVEIDHQKRGNPQIAGAFYLDDLRFIYEENEDFKGPLFDHTKPKGEVVYKDTFTFRTTIHDDMSGVDASTIIMKVNDNIVNHTFCNETKELKYKIKSASEEIIHICVSASDFAGNKSIPTLEKRYEIDLSLDTEGPTISNITPTEFEIMYTREPRITFHLVDEKSGVKTEDIHVTIDGKKQFVYFDEQTGWAYVSPQHPLSLGEHTFSISAKDRVGNESEPVSRTFIIKEITRPANDDTIQIAIIPDTHTNDYLKLSMCHIANKNINFTIHMGDLVDQGTTEEFQNVLETIERFNKAPLFTIPGNHESFQGDLHKYVNYFGSPTYHLDYGETRFVFLNTAFSQSISKSDSTQFHYLKRLLKRNIHNNIVIISHVPTKDPFGTAHEMDKKDARKLEKILANYKKKHPKKNITVLFGHLHVLHEWEKDGVQYIITGNGARKGYVSQERGNILGYGIFQLTSDGVSYSYKPHIEKIKIYHKDKMIERLTLLKGSTTKLQLHVKINELESSYNVDITPFQMIERKWTSSNKHIIHVDDQGVLRGLNVGEAYITVQVSNQVKQIKVHVIDSSHLLK